VAVFDPDGVWPTRFIDNVPNNSWAAMIALDTATGLAYVAGGGTPTAGFTVFDTRTEQVVANHPAPVEIAGVAVDGDRIYAGEACTDGSILVFDKGTLAQLGRIAVGAVSWSGSCPNAESFAFSRDHGTGWATIVEAGAVRFETGPMVLTDYLDLATSPSGYFGDSRAIRLVNDHLLYMARIREGLDLYENSPWSLLAHVSSDAVFVGLAVSPDQSTVAVSVGGSVAFGGREASAPQIYDVGPALSLRYAYPPRYGRTADDIVFHPDGKRFYVMAEYQVDVYLVRSH
jgi:hypothetical protein